MIALARLRYCDAIENDVTLTEQGVEEIIYYARVDRKVHILSRGRDQFISDVEFDIEINVRIFIGWYKNLPDPFDGRG